MRRSALQLGISLILLIVATAVAKQRQVRSVDLNEQHKLEPACICDSLRPQSYILEIEPILAENKFRGRVRINVSWTDINEDISLYAHPELQIADTDIKVRRLSYVRDEDDSSSEEEVLPGPINITEIKRNPRKQMLTISLAERLKRNTICEIDITYMGNITTNDTSGFFLNHYLGPNNQKHTYLASYLRLNNARKLFPGYDELEYKTKFRLLLTRPENMTTLSNTPLEKSVEVPNKPGLVQDVFAETPEIATYQLAFVISDLKSLTPTKLPNPVNGKQLEVRVWGRQQYLEALKDVPDKIVRIVNYLQDYFNSSIGLPKLDIVAMPTYTATKASDNWGLMTFKESELSSPLVWNTAYELTYQWIGQYITPYRWMDANKGLNSFLASMTTLDINPDELKGKWPMNILYSLYYGYGKFYGANRGRGIIRDAKFSKIELVFRMFYYILGKDNFKASMRHFIQTRSTAPQDPSRSGKHYARLFMQSDIYDSMNYVANKSKALPDGLTINEVADTWNDQERLPLVTAIRNYNNNTITISQKTYVRESRVSEVTRENVYRWNIPLVMQSQRNWNNSDYAPKAWLLEGKDDLNIPDIADKDSFIVVNPEEIGLFPVNYDVSNWAMLVNYLQGPDFERIPTLTRAKLLHDAWNLAYADELCFDIALNMTLFLKHEKSHIVWEPFFTMIDHISSRIAASNVSSKFETYTRSLLEPMYTEPCESVQTNEPSWKTHLRGLARYFLCRAGYEPCIAEAREQYAKWMTDKEPDKGNPVANEFICPVFKWGTFEEWNFGLERVMNFPRNSPERKLSERTYLLKTLASCPKDPAKIERLLVVSLERNGNFSDADIHLILSMLSGNANGYRSLFEYLISHWDDLRDRLAAKKSIWTSLIQSATSSFSSQEGYDLVAKLLAERGSQLDAAQRLVLEEALKKIEQETRWSEMNLPVIETWFDENNERIRAAPEDATRYWKTELLCPSRSGSGNATTSTTSTTTTPAA